MPGLALLSSRVLTVLQFTRAALVFTALADTLAALLLRTALVPGAKLMLVPTILALAASACLYCFGMALNDLVDHRRDAVTAAQKPLPSGRLGLYNAHVIVTLLALGSLLFGGLYALTISSAASFVFLVLTVLLINFYNFAGKYLVSPGIITLGLVRMSHVLFTAPEVPVVWHPLWLFTHVVILSAVAYVWEEKRPRITGLHRALIAGGVLGVNVTVVAVLLARRMSHHTDVPFMAALSEVLSLRPALLIPVAATLAFFVVSNLIAGNVSAPSETPAPEGLRTRRRRAGQQLILAGLLWLIVLDAAFVLTYISASSAFFILLLLPVAYGSVRLMRFWNALRSFAKPPSFRRADTL